MICFLKLCKTSQNDGLSQDIFGRAKRGGKSLILGFQEKKHWRGASRLGGGASCSLGGGAEAEFIFLILFAISKFS